MHGSSQDSLVTQTQSLLHHYSFDLGSYTPDKMVSKWLENYSLSWVRSAVIEALYLGRYKAVSVEQILQLWLRRGSITVRHDYEFEQLVCRNLPQYVPIVTPEYRPPIFLESIPQFTPVTGDIEFYQKLQAVAQQKMIN